MRKLPVRHAFIVFLLSAAGAVVFAGGQQEAEGEQQANVDYIGIAAVMIRDGNFDRAERALEQVDLDDEDLDLERFYTLSGLVQLRRGNNREAIAQFEQAQTQGQDDPVLNVYLAQAYYGEQRYQDAIAAIDGVPNLAQYPSLYGLLADSYWQLDDTSAAYSTLGRAAELFPSQAQFVRQQIFYLVELGLTQEAVTKSLEYLSKLEEEPAAYVTVGEALRRGGNPDLAVETLEMGVLQHPHDRQIRLALAQAYLDLGRPRTAASMVERAAANDPSLYFEAAEIYRRAGAYDRALFLNSLVLDEGNKAIQRFHVLLSMERFESAIALESRLQRTGNLNNDANRYAMAYGFFQVRKLDRAVEYLNRIDSTDFFRRATQLRQAIETVRESESFSEGAAS